MNLIAAWFTLVALPAVVQGSGDTWVTQVDRDAAADAKTAKSVYCLEEDSRADIDREDGRAQLERGAGGSNVILEILKESESSDDFADKAREKITPVWLAMKAGPLIFAIFLFVFWSACCWSACCCCRCCRCGEKSRNTWYITKLVILILGGALVIGILACAFFALAGYGEAVDGFDNVACTSAELVDSTLAGQSDPFFIGLIPLLDVFQELDDQLKITSPMMTEVNSLVSSTSEITDAVTIAAETISALQDALSNMPSGVGSNLHTCEYCDQLAPVLETTASAIEDGVASALSSARLEIEKQLSPEKSAELQESLRAGAEPLTQLKDLVRSSLSTFTDTKKYSKFQDVLAGPVFTATSIIIVLAFALMGCMCTSLVSFAFLEHCCQSAIVDEQKKTTPYNNNCVHRCSGCTWCCGFFYAMLAFFVGGLLNAVVVPLSSVCLIMEDLSGEMITNIGPGLGLDLDGDQGAMVLDMIDQCFVPAEGTNAKLLDIMFSRNATTGQKVTMREQIVDSTKDQITAQFDQVTAMMADSQDLADSSEIKALIDMLSDPIDMMIVPDQSHDFSADSRYQDIFKQPELAALIASSVRCENGTVNAAVPTLGNHTIAGVKEFEDRLGSFGTVIRTRPECANSVLCADPGTLRGDACAAGNKYMELKQNIRDLTTFRCDVFLDPSGGGDCDPKDMMSTSGGRVWTGGCINSDGTMKRKTKSCSLPEFVTYVQEYGNRIQKAMQRIDDTVARKGSEVNEGLRRVVKQHIIDPIESVAIGVTCGFIGDAYEDVVAGMCYQGVVGFQKIADSYLACGILTLFMLVLMYGVWRRAIDNVNKNNDEKKAYSNRETE